MAGPADIIKMRELGGNKLEVEIFYAASREGGSRVVSPKEIDRDDFCDWDRFNRWLDNVGLGSVVEEGLKPTKSNLREAWGFWKAQLSDS